MINYQLPLINIDRLIKLGDVERELGKVFYTPPSRPTIVGWIEDGTLDGKQIGRGNNYYVFESSLNKFILKTQESFIKLAT